MTARDRRSVVELLESVLAIGAVLTLCAVVVLPVIGCVWVAESIPVSQTGQAAIGIALFAVIAGGVSLGAYLWSQKLDRPQ
jgi:hypothetical protein